MKDLRPDGFGPMTMGHEGVGVIEQLHPSTEGKGFKVGDKIGMLYIDDCCFECDGCQAHGTLCEKPNPGGAKVKGLMTHGFFAEYALCDWENAIHLPDSLPIEKMSPLFCAGITGRYPPITFRATPRMEIGTDAFDSLPFRGQMRTEARPVVWSRRMRWLGANGR